MEMNKEKIREAITKIFKRRVAFGITKNEQSWIDEITDEVAEALDIESDGE